MLERKNPVRENLPVQARLARFAFHAEAVIRGLTRASREREPRSLDLWLVREHDLIQIDVAPPGVIAIGEA